ncbi:MULTISPECIES: Lrp/AsnC family transcriptional regulator [unclassified Crossiella]|uniref:Lrp/AsnC family transcriptional regulator n=1 Tax=unclassified Crossiella TaxID=2620835 RepID=UPI001FFE986E|nr:MULTISPECIES: Lrp/AsnC family transcriptional regulator [unclassified Crossiella]MCK2245403.1 Lrp/AsnC family transcriptional regulator [Crossiella sp. S99.2]MCK2259010.1 Lrp/AsnC family transcriptional regulator [Crossiella sp. S99.1]
MDLDELDWRILDLLQQDGRMTFTELARRVNLSAPATTERVRRLEQLGVITGYAAVVDPQLLGLPVQAIVRVRVRSLDSPRFRERVLALPSVCDADHVTGDDCWLLRVRCKSMAELEQLVDHAQQYGETTTSLVFSSHVRNRPVSSPG